MMKIVKALTIVFFISLLVFRLNGEKEAIKHIARTLLSIDHNEEATENIDKQTVTTESNGVQERHKLMVVFDEFLDRYGVVFYIPATLIGSVLIIVFLYKCCYQGKILHVLCPCIYCCKRQARNVAGGVINNYGVGMEVDKHGKITYYDATEEELEALSNLKETGQSMFG